MKKSALGLIETYGLVGAIEGLDVALKSANVSLIGCEYVKGGRVTIEITGDVSAVKAAVEAAAVAVEELGSLISVHVIPKAYDELWEMLQGGNIRTKDKKEKIQKNLEVQTKEKNIENINEDKSLENTNDEIKQEIKSETKEELNNTKDKTKNTKEEIRNTKEELVENTKEDVLIDIKEKDSKEEKTQGEYIEVKTREELQNMKVQELRTLARKMELTSLTKKQIKFSKKEQLIEAILDHWKRR